MVFHHLFIIHHSFHRFFSPEGTRSARPWCKKWCRASPSAWRRPMAPLASDRWIRMDPDHTRLDPDISGYSLDILWHFYENSLNEMSQLRSFMNHSCQTHLIIWDWWLMSCLLSCLLSCFMIHVRLRWRFESLVAMWISPKLRSMRRRSLWRLPKSAGPRDSWCIMWHLRDQTFEVLGTGTYCDRFWISWSFAERWDIITRKAGDQRRGAQNCASIDVSKTWQRMERTPMPCQPARCLHPAGSLGDYRWVRSWVEQDPNRIRSQEKLLSFFLSCLAPSMIVFGVGNRQYLEDSPSARQPWTCPWIHCGQNHSADWDNAGSRRCGDDSIWFKIHRHEISLLGWKCLLF